MTGRKGARVPTHHVMHYPNFTYQPSKRGDYGHQYDGILDAQDILENVMARKNWSIEVRDQLARHLVEIVDVVKRGRGQWD